MIGLLLKISLIGTIFNLPFSEIAVSPNSSVAYIYQKNGKEWSKIHELTEHSGRITGNLHKQEAATSISH